MVLFLLALLLAETLSGIYVANDIADVGPFTAIVPARVANAIEASHAIVWETLFAAIILHVLAVFGYAAVKGQNLLLPMIIGTKVLPENVACAAHCEHGEGSRAFRRQRRGCGHSRQSSCSFDQLLGGITWPRISPAGWDCVCTFIYQSPAENCCACSGVSVALPVIGFAGGLPWVVSQITTGPFSPRLAGP